MNISYISSKDNDQIKKVVSLHNQKGQNEHNLFFAEGIRGCTTLLESPLIEPETLYITEKQYKIAEDLCHRFKKLFFVVVVNDIVMEKISALKTPSGILLVARIPQQIAYADQTPGIVLAEVADPGNMGTIIRTAVACGIKHCFVLGGAHPWSPKVVQASAGFIGHINLYQMDTHEFIKNTNKAARCALVVDKKAHPITHYAMHDKLLIVGSEAHGINPLLLANSEHHATIPMESVAESLNAATAASIAIYLATSNT